MNTISERLRAARKAKGLSLREVSKAAGYSEPMLSKVETGKAAPSERFLRAICYVMKVSPLWLRTGDGEMFVGDPSESDSLKIVEFLRETEGLSRLARAVADLAERLAQEYRHLDPRLRKD